MAKNDNLKDFLTDVADAIREKKGTTDLINPQSFSDEIRAFDIGGGGNTPSRPKWTGHADVDGLRAIGWTDEDIAYYQENGVNWNEEDDQYHLVTDDNKALYGVLTANNIPTYRDRIVYLPKIDTSGLTSMTNYFIECHALVALPMIDTSNVTIMTSMFNSCLSLVCVPPFDTSRVENMTSMFQTCVSLMCVPEFETSKVEYMYSMFNTCYSLKVAPRLNTSKVRNFSNMFYGCHSLVSVPVMDTSEGTNMISMFQSCHALASIGQIEVNTYLKNLNGCYSLINAFFSNVNNAFSLEYANLLSKDSLIYLINNEAATSAITIKLASYAYTRLSNDADIVAALANHPNVSISQ